MTKPVSGLDHVVIGVDDLSRGAETYSRLGFTLSPRGVHSASMGTANHTIMLKQDYFELLAILAPTERNLRWQRALERGEGAIGIAMATTDAGSTYEAWSAAGLHPRDVIDFSRPVDRPDGSKLDASFKVVSLPEETNPDVGLFACEHLTRDAVWLPELLDHPNTALGIRGLTVTTTRPAEHLDSWKRVLPGAAVIALDGGLRFEIGRHFVDLLEPATAALRLGTFAVQHRPGVLALEFAVGDLEECRMALGRGAVPFRDEAGHILVAPDQACGVALVMTAGV